MTYIYKEAIYIDIAGERIDCWLDLPDQAGWTPYTLDVNDLDTTIDNAILLAQMQAAGDIAAYVPPTPLTQDEIDATNAFEIRGERSMLLTSFVDPVVSNPLRWSGLTSTQQTEVTQYRTDLLNITTQSTFPTSVTWPTLPTVLELT